MKNTLFALPVLAAIAMAPTAASAETDSERKIYEAVQNQQWDVAEKLLREGLQLNPGDPKQLLNLAYILQNSDRKAEAADIYARVLTLDSNPIVTMDSDAKVRAKGLARERMASIYLSQRQN